MKWLCVFSCVTQNWAASWQGSQLLLDVFSVSDTSPRPLSQTKEKSYICSCKTVCDAAHPNRITGFHSKQMKEKQRQHPSLLTDGGHTLQEVVSWAGIQNEHAHMHFFFFPQMRELSRFCCVSAVSLREGEEWFWDSLWWLSSPAETSSHFHFCCFFADFPAGRHWHNDYCNPRDSLATAKRHRANVLFVFSVVSSCMLGFRVQRSTFVYHSKNWHCRSTHTHTL